MDPDTEAKNQRKAKAKALKADWLMAFMEFGHRRACEIVQISTGLPAYWRKNDPEFARDHDEVSCFTAERLESLVDAAIEGYAEMTPVQAQLVKWRLAALRPATYRERLSVEQSGPGGGPIEVNTGNAGRGMDLLDRWSDSAFDD